MTETNRPRQKGTSSTRQQPQSTTSTAVAASSPRDGSAHPGFSNEEQLRESSNAARKSLRAKRKAYEYMQAAMGAGDTEARQKLLQDALNKEIEAESFGKVAKWINSGAFQGFAYGCVPGITLGALTGTLVGGLVCLITGGVGAGIGALSGPTFQLGDVIGQGIRKITGDLPGWEATQEQKDMLSSMVLDVKRQDMPSDEDLEAISEYGELAPGGSGFNQSWTEYATSYLPSFGSKQQQAQGPMTSSVHGQRDQRQKDQSARALKKRMSESATQPLANRAQGSNTATPSGDRKNTAAAKNPSMARGPGHGKRKTSAQPLDQDGVEQASRGHSDASGEPGTAPEIPAPLRQGNVAAKKTSVKPGTSTATSARRKQPRKLEMRS